MSVWDTMLSTQGMSQWTVRFLTCEPSTDKGEPQLPPQWEWESYWSRDVAKTWEALKIESGVICHGNNGDDEHTKEALTKIFPHSALSEYMANHEIRCGEGMNEWNAAVDKLVEIFLRIAGK